MCRVCLDHATSIFKLTDLVTRTRFEECTSVVVIPDQNFPMKLCAKCHNQLVAWNAFRTQAIDTDRRLKELLISSCSSTIDPNVSPSKVANIWVDGLTDTLDERAEAEEINVPDLYPIECVVVHGGSVPSDEENQIDHGDVECILIEDNSPSSNVLLAGESNSQAAHNNIRLAQPDNSDERPFKCLDCATAYMHKYHLIRHEREVHGKQNSLINSSSIFSDVLWQDKYQPFVRLERLIPFQAKETPPFLQIDIDDQQIQSDHCEGAFATKPRKNGVERQCLYCPLKFTNGKKLDKHEQSHKKEVSDPKKMCLICNKTFSRPGEVTRHMRTIHPEAFEKQWAERMKQQEQEILDGRKPFTCEICHKAFSTKRFLKGHMHSHCNDRPFNCQYCNSTYKTKSNVTRHEREVHLKHQMINFVSVEVGEGTSTLEPTPDEMCPFLPSWGEEEDISAPLVFSMLLE